jgi:hypothetical protein
LDLRVVRVRHAPIVADESARGQRASGCTSGRGSAQWRERRIVDGYPPTPGCFLEVLILLDFKSFAPELVILMGLKCDFSEVLILEGLDSTNARLTRIVCSTFMRKHIMNNTFRSTLIVRVFEEKR